MDGAWTGTSLNGASAKTKQNENETKEKVNKTMLLKQQIEENKIRMLQREKDISNSKKNLEQLFTQLDRSCSGASLNMSMDVEDVRDAKIASLESSLSALKSEKRDLEMQLLSLETIQEAKECLELQMGELSASHENVVAEKIMLQARLQNFHEIEDENDELKSKLDRLSYENNNLKQDLETRDKTIHMMESKLSKLHQELEGSKSKNASLISLPTAEEFQRQINDLVNERQQLQSECERQIHDLVTERQQLQSECERQINDLLNEKQQLQTECETLQVKLSEALTVSPVASPEVKVSTLGAGKKQRSKRGKATSEGEDAVQAQIASLTAQRDAFEAENNSLKHNLVSLEERLAEGESERRTLQQRIDLLMAELATETAAANNNDLANLQTLLEEKELEFAALSVEINAIRTEKAEAIQRLEEADGELFKMRTKCRDIEYMLNSKEESIKELQLQLEPKEASPSPPQAVKVSTLGAKKSRSKKGRRTANEPVAEIAPTEESANFEAQIESLNSRIASLEQENASLSSQIAHIATLEEKICSSEDEKRTLQQRVELLLSELDTTDSKDVTNLQTVLHSKEAEFEDIIAKLNELRAEKDEILQRAEAADSELFKLRTQLRDVQYMLNSKEELQERLDAANDELEQQKDLVIDLEAKINEKESRKSDEDTSTVAHLQETLRQTRHELSDVENELSIRSETIQKLEKSCSSLNKDVSEKNTEIHQLREDLQEAEVVLAEKDAKLKSIQDELNRMKVRADADASLSLLESELNHSQMETEILRNDLETRSSQLDECKQFGCRLEAQLEEAKARQTELVSLNETLNSQKIAAEDKVSQLSEKYKKLAANYKQKLQAIQQLEVKLVNIKQATESDGGEPQLLQMRLAESETELNSLREQLEKHKESSEQLNKTKQSLQKELLLAQEELQESQRLREQLESIVDLSDELAEVRQMLSKTEFDFQNSLENARYMNDENKTLQEELIQLREAAAITRNSLEQAEDQLQSSQAEIHRLMQDNQALLEQLRQIEELNDVSRLENELKSARIQAEEMEGKLHEELNSLGQVKSALEKELATSQDHLQSSQSEIQRLMQDNQSQLDQLRQIEEHRGAANQEIANHIENELKSAGLQAEENKKLHEELNSICQIKSALEAELAALQEQTAFESRNLLEQLDNASVKIQQLEDLQKKGETDFQHHSTAIESLQQQLGKLTEEVEALRQERDELKSYLEQGSEASAIMQNQLSDLWHHKEDLIRRNAQLEEEMKDDARVASMNKEIQELRDQLEALQWDLDTKTKEVATVQQLRDQLGAVQWELDVKLAELDQQKERIGQLEQQCADTSAWIETNLGAAIKSRNEELEQQLAELNNQYSGLYSSYGSKLFEMTTLENQLAEAKLKIEENDVKLQLTHNNLLDELNCMKERVSELVQERDELKISFNSVQQEKESQLETLRSSSSETLELLNWKIAELTDVHRQLDDYRIAAEESINEKSEQLEELKKQLEAQSKSILDVQEIGMLRLNLADLSAERDDLNFQLEDVQAQLAAFETKMSETDEVRSILDTTVSYLESKVSELQNELATITSGREEDRTIHAGQLAALNEERDGLAARLASVESQSQELDSLRLTLQDAERMLKESDKQAVARCEELELQLADSMRCLAEEQQKCRHLLDDHEEMTRRLAEVDQLQQEIAQFKEEAGTLRSQLEQSKSQAEEVSQLRVKLFEAVSDKDDLESSVQTLEEELASAQIELAAAQQANKALQMELESNRGDENRLITLQDELDASRSSLDALKTELEAGRASSFELSARCADLDMERNLLVEKCMELKDSLGGFEEKCAELERMKVALEEENARLQSSQAGLSELAQLRMALMNLTDERDDANEKLLDAEEKLTELTSLRITNSELSMELDEALARIQVIEEDRQAEIAEMKRQLADTTAKLVQQVERIDRVSVERDQLQQAVSRQGDDDRIAQLESELHETKIKAAKSLRQVKLLKAEMAKAAQSKNSGGDDYFNFAVEEELRKQVSEAEKNTAEKFKEIERLLARIDTLEGANERFLQAKERQDNDMAMLQQRNRELQSQMASLEWDNTAPEATPVVKENISEELAALETTISQLTDDNEHYQDLLEELKMERQAVEAELKQKIASFEADVAEKSKLLDEFSQEIDNKDRLLSDAYESVAQLRKQVGQLSEGSLIEDLKRENENLVDMIRQLSTTGTLDAATLQRLRDEIESGTAEHFQHSSDLSEGAIDWRGAFNEVQIEVEYLRSQNNALLNRLQEAGLVWDEGADPVTDESDRTELLRLQMDDAIRNVHERDMRCQELTWEITKLLEERDTLQLRLSNALRQNHEMQQELKDFSATASGASPISDIAAKLRELKQLNYSLDVQLRREQEERQTIERQLMALYGTRGGSTSPIYANGSRRRHADGSTPETDLNSSQESLSSGQVLSDWLKGKGSSDVQHI